MRAHIIEDGVVKNTVEVESLDSMPNLSLIDGEVGGKGWLWDGENLTPPPEPEPTPDELKMKGVEILGVMCSATRDDQAGLSAIAIGVMKSRDAGQVFPATEFYFANGNSLIINDDNFDTLYSAWVTFRQSFFLPQE